MNEAKNENDVFEVGPGVRKQNEQMFTSLMESSQRKQTEHFFLKPAWFYIRETLNAQVKDLH